MLINNCKFFSAARARLALFAVMKIKELEQHLSSLDGFEKPKIKYEQYATDAHLACKLAFLQDFIKFASEDDVHGSHHF